MTEPPICAECGYPIKQVDLYGTSFFEHAPKHDRLTWWHIDKDRNITHQAEPVKYR